jgi:hypothetical protein
MAMQWNFAAKFEDFGNARGCKERKKSVVVDGL